MERVCANCRFGSFFDPRQDEIERFGSDVMGCKRPNWESYTEKTSTCEAYSERDTGMTQHNENSERQPRCPECGGEADNGFDREYPPNPYSCTKCFSNGEVMTDNTEAMREAFEAWAIWQIDWFETTSEIDSAEGRLAWRAYQAALQSPQVTAEELKKFVFYNLIAIGEKNYAVMDRDDATKSTIEWFVCALLSRFHVIEKDPRHDGK